MPGYIHHIEWSVGDAEAVAEMLVGQFGFRRFAERKKRRRQVAVRSGSTVFLVTQREEEEDEDRKQQGQDDGFPTLPSGKSIDSLFNVCLEVGDVDAVVKGDDDDEVLLSPTTVEDEEGSVRVAAVKSCVGNVVHTIVDTKNYGGAFLPGFDSVGGDGEDDEDKDDLTSHVDHVTYVLGPGQSDGVLRWYARRFGMRRFLVSRQEMPEEGVVIGEEVGMRMKVGEWLSSWMCREVGVELKGKKKKKNARRRRRRTTRERTNGATNGHGVGNGADNVGESEEEEEKEEEEEEDDLNFKLVLAEPLEGAVDSHVQKFLDAHGGPGLQHIGLTTGDATAAVEAMSARGAGFRRPPPTYYKMESKVREILDCGRDLETFRRLGLLLDTEADVGEGDDEDREDSARRRALVQIFTRPLFAEDTFFLEVLERDGARGFGAGNITALARSIQLHQQEMEVAAASS